MKFNCANIILLLTRKYLLLILCIITFNNAFTQTGLGVNKVVIDPGHGGKDPGAISPNNNYEKTVVLKVSLLLGDLIKKSFCKLLNKISILEVISFLLIVFEINEIGI